MKALGRAGTVALVLGGLAALLLVAARLQGFQVYSIQGGSMGRSLPVGSVAIVQPVDPATIAAGDVIAFRGPQGGLYTHRVIEVLEGGLFRTQGDANEEADITPAPASRVLGRVRLSIPFLGYFAYLARTPFGYVLFQLLPGVAIIILEVRRLRKLWPGLKIT